MITEDLREIFRLTAAALDNPAVEVEEDWRDNNTTISWGSPRPQEIEELLAYIKKRRIAGGPSLVVEEEKKIRLVRPEIVSHFLPSAGNALIFFRKETLIDAIVSYSTLWRNDFVKESLVQCQKIVAPGYSNSFRLGDILFVTPDEIRVKLYAPDGPTPLRVPEEELRRALVLHEGAHSPEPSLFWPMHPKARGPVVDALLKIAFLHLSACLCSEVLSSRRLIAKGGTTARFTWDVGAVQVDHNLVENVAELCRWLYASPDSYGQERKTVTLTKVADCFASKPDWSEGSSIISRSIGKISEESRDAFQAFLLGKIDKYFEDQKKLAENVKSFSDTLAERAKSLISSLFRDAFLSVVAVALSMGRLLAEGKLNGAAASTLLTILALLAATSGLVHIYLAVVEGVLAWKEFETWSSRIRSIIPAERYNEVAGQRVVWRVRHFVISLALGTGGYALLVYGILNTETLLAH